MSNWNWIMPIAGAAVFGAALYASKRNVASEASKPAIVVDLYGDSVLYGYGVTESPQVFIQRNRPHWTVIDHSAGGLDTAELLNGYSTPDPGLDPAYWRNGPQPAFSAVNRAGVEVCVIQTGFNDAFHSVPNYEQNLRSVVQIALGEGRKVVIGGVFNLQISVPLRASYNEISHKIAREFRLQHAGWGEDYQGAADVHTDTIHRTQLASNRMTARLIEAIERAAYT